MKSRHTHAEPAVLWRISVPAGLASFAAELARRDFGQYQGADEIRFDESSVSFKAPITLSAPPPWANAAAVILAAADHCTALESAANSFARELLREGANAVSGTLENIVSLNERNGGRRQTFALRFFQEGSPSPLEQNARSRLEGALTSVTGLRPDSQYPGLEFQLALRSDHTASLLWNRFPSQTGRGEAGALPASTARLLVELSRPGATDIFLDPFCGSGAIPLERARLPYKMIFAGDRDEAETARVKKALAEPRMAKKRKTIFPKVLDARDLSRFDTGFFTAIVTDPPWGQHERIETDALEELYQRFLAEAARCLAPHGRLVLLCGRSGPVAEGTISIPFDFETEARYEVLVSGQKALVLCLVRR